MTNKLVTEAATEAVVRFTVFAMELDECLGIGSRLAMHTCICPVADDAVGFGLQLLKETERAFTKFLRTLVASVGKKDGSNGVDDQQVFR